MCETPKSSCSSPTTEEPDVLTSYSDQSFLQSVQEGAEQEKQYLQCPRGGPDPLRHGIYHSVFTQVIGRATAYQRLLLTIKAEYDDIIRALSRREGGVNTAVTSQPLIGCRRRAAQLRDRIFILQIETEKLQEVKKSKEQRTLIPGLTLAESKDTEALDRHLEHLEIQNATLLGRKSHCISLEVRDELDGKLQTVEHQRNRLSEENARLKLTYQRLRFVYDSLSCVGRVGRVLPMDELLASTLQAIGQISMTDDDAIRIDGELLEGEEPTRVNGSTLLADCLNRFLELFDSARFEDAAFHAARCPRGVLRNSDTMDMFKAVQVHPGSAPPPLLFFRALLMSAAPGDKLSAPVSLQGVRCALQQGATELVTHGVAQNKLTFSEDLGDLLTEHAQTDHAAADTCLTLAAVIYDACGRDTKTALSMCRRGLIHSAAEFMSHRDLTAEDCIWVLRRSPSLSLLQLLTRRHQEGAALLSVGVACSTLLVDPQQQQWALDLLDDIMSRGGEVLERVILEDSSSSPDVWTRVASLCAELNRDDLRRAVLSVLDQSGTRVLSPDLEGAQLMEHVFL